MTEISFSKSFRKALKRKIRNNPALEKHFWERVTIFSSILSTRDWKLTNYQGQWETGGALASSTMLEWSSHSSNQVEPCSLTLELTKKFINFYGRPCKLTADGCDMDIKRHTSEFQDKAPTYRHLEGEALYIVRQALDQTDIKLHSITSRVKRIESFLDKIQRNNRKSHLTKFKTLLAFELFVCSSRI